MWDLVPPLPRLMPCFKPLRAWYGHVNARTGRRGLVFSEPKFTLGSDSAGDVHYGSEGSTGIRIPCGQCLGCKLERSRQWAMRILHECKSHESNCFLTLTFREESLPLDGSVRVRDLQLFFKRLRKMARVKLRHYSCAEYGDLRSRPHYHSIVFGFAFLGDRYRFGGSSSAPTYRSDMLERAWPHGNSLIANVTFETAAYVARYCVKKITGPLADQEYVSFDEDRGEFVKIEPEFSCMSRGGRVRNGVNPGGIGKQWYREYRKEVYLQRGATISVRGRSVAPPVAYNRWLEVDDPEAFQRLHEQRLKGLGRMIGAGDWTRERLAVRARVALARHSANGARRLENGA